MRGEMNSCRFEISNRRENKFCSHEVLFGLYFKTAQYFGGHFTLGSIYMIFYHPKCNSFLSKWLIWNPYPQRVSNAHTNQMKYPTTLQLYISFWVNSVHMKISCWFEISFRSKWPIWNPYHFEFHFTSIYVNTNKEPAKHRSEIFNQNENSSQFEFISPHMWM